MLWVITWHSASVFDVLGITSLWFLPAGLRFSCLLLLGWPGLLIDLCATLLMSTVQFAMSGQRLPDVFSWPMFWFASDWYALSIAYAVVVFPLRRHMGDRWNFTRSVHSFIFVIAALAVSTLAALVGTFKRVFSGTMALDQWDTVMTSWLIGDFIGIITLAPLLMVRVWPRLRLYLRQGEWPRTEKPLSQVVAQAKAGDRRIVLIVLVALLLVFAAPPSLFSGPNLPLLALLLLLPQIGIALRYGLRGALLAALLLDSGLVVLVALLHQGESAFQYQLIMVVTALVGLWLGGAVESRNQHIERNRDFARASNDLLWETDENGILLSLEGRLAKHVSLSAGISWGALVERLEPQPLPLFEQALASRRPFRHLEIEILSDVGVRRWIHVNGLPVWDDSGTLIGYRGTATDITQTHRAKVLLDNYTQELLAAVHRQTAQLQQTNNELVVKEQRLQVLLAAVPVGVLELGVDDCCRYLNVNAGKLTGCDPAQAKGRSFLEFVHADDLARVEEVWRNHRQSTEVESLEFRLSQSNLWCTAYWNQLRNIDHSSDGTIVVLADSTARRLQDQQLWVLAHHDPLTDLPNRNLFWDRCRQAMSLAKRTKKGVAILWMDLDGLGWFQSSQ